MIQHLLDDAAGNVIAQFYASLPGRQRTTYRWFIPEWILRYGYEANTLKCKKQYLRNELVAQRRLFRECPTCHGTGNTKKEKRDRSKMPCTEDDQCRTCHGTGEHVGEGGERAEGTPGYVEERKSNAEVVVVPRRVETRTIGTQTDAQLLDPLAGDEKVAGEPDHQSNPRELVPGAAQLPQANEEDGDLDEKREEPPAEEVEAPRQVQLADTLYDPWHGRYVPTWTTSTDNRNEQIAAFRKRQATRRARRGDKGCTVM